MINKTLERSVIVLSWAAASILVMSVAILLGFLFAKGLGTLSLKLLFGSTPPLAAITLRQQVFDGLFPAVAGTFLLVICSTITAIPIGIAGGIFMAEYAGIRQKAFFSLLFDILAGIPSIIIGLAGLSLTIFLHRLFPGRLGPSLMISALSLALLVLPYLIRSTQNALESVDPLIRLTAPALGASRIQNVVKVLLPNSMADIIGGIILAVGRCAEDTAVIMLTGAVAVAGVPHDPLSQYEALPFYIYYISSQYGSPDELASGYGAAILLLALCTCLLIFAFVIQKRLVTLLLYR